MPTTDKMAEAFGWASRTLLSRNQLIEKAEDCFDQAKAGMVQDVDQSPIQERAVIVAANDSWIALGNGYAALANLAPDRTAI